MYDFGFTVHSYETDPEGRLAFPGLCAYLQEAAWHDAERMGAGVARLAEGGLAWSSSGYGWRCATTRAAATR